MLYAQENIRGGERLEKRLLEELYRRYYRELYIYVYSLCGQKSVAEDILQETFLKAFTALKDTHTNMRAWLYLVARNLCCNMLKKDSRILPVEEPDALPEKCAGTVSESDPLSWLIREEEKRRLWTALRQLKSPRREILILQYFGGFGQKEIAYLLQMKPENVRVQAHRAKKELREKMGGGRI